MKLEAAKSFSLNALFIRIKPTLWQGCLVCVMKKALKKNYASEPNKCAASPVCDVLFLRLSQFFNIYIFDI